VNRVVRSTSVPIAERRRILVALDLLAWIDAQETTLEDLRQDDLDRWLDEENTQRRNRIRYFLGWTADRGLSRRSPFPPSRVRNPLTYSTTTNAGNSCNAA
jgi:hypothetical protein